MSWRVQEKGRHTGYRRYWAINDATKEDYYVSHSWFSEGDVFERRYYNHRWECTCGNAACAHIAIAKAWLAEERKAKKAAKKLADAQDREIALEVNRQIDARRKGPHVAKPPFEEMPTMPAEEHHVPADPRNCEYWREEPWAQWCTCEAACPHKLELVRCGLRSGKEIFGKVIV